MLITRPFLFIAILLLSTASWSAGSKNNLYADNITALPKNSRILVLPLYANNLMNEEEQSQIFQELISQLKALNHTIDSPSFLELGGEEFAPQLEQNYSLLLSQNIKNTQKKADAKSNFAKIIQYVGPLVIMPSIVSRKAKLQGTNASWDNGVHYLRLKGTSSEFGWTGEIEGLSLKLEAYDNNGTWVFTSYGSVSLPVIANIKERKYIRKEHLFSHKKDAKKLKKGVKYAIYPIKKKLKL